MPIAFHRLQSIIASLATYGNGPVSNNCTNFWIVSNMIGKNWYINVVLICMHFMNEVECLFICLETIYICCVCVWTTQACCLSIFLFFLFLFLFFWSWFLGAFSVLGKLHIICKTGGNIFFPFVCWLLLCCFWHAEIYFDVAKVISVFYKATWFWIRVGKAFPTQGYKEI